MAQLKNSRMQWRRSAVAAAVGLMVLSGASYGQSNTTGNIFGQVAAAAGTTVVIENTATGVKRTLTPDASGRFVANSMPTGSYKATLVVNGKVVSTATDIEVTVSQSREVLFSGGATQVVQVVGKVAQIDVSSSSNGSTFTAKQLAALPIARNLDAIIQLAPNTTRADPRYAGGASMGGGAPSENSYYINGFPVTNPLSQLGASELPFGAIANADIQTGGFGAEFGRSIGGVVNIITKSGGNTWEAGVSASITPNSLRSKPKDILFPSTGVPIDGVFTPGVLDGTLYRRRGDNTQTESSFGGYIGGPIIKDQLFMFVAFERLNDNSNSVLNNVTSTSLTGGWSERKNVNDRYLAKFDWNLTTDHRLELTMFGDKYKQDEKLYGYDYATLTHDNVLSATNSFTNIPEQTIGDGASAQVLKYTGYLTDDFTLNVLAGQSKSPHKNSYVPASGASGLYQVFVNPLGGVPGLTYNSPYPFGPNTTIVPDNSSDKVTSMRLDLEYRLGDHSIRAGVDQVQLKSTNAGEFLLGGGQLSYSRTTNPALVFGPDTVNRKSVSEGGALTDGQGGYYYGRLREFTDATSAGSDQGAMYIEDKWQVNKNLLLTAGLRNETYKNKNGDGETFLKVDNQINPRFAFAWDVNGDASTSVYGSAGRYGVQIPTHLAVRGASRSTLTNHYFTYQGVDANGQPTGVQFISDVYSPNNEFGQAKDANTVAGRKLTPSAQDEFTIGLKQAMSDSITVGGSFTYRKLISTIDDFCDQRPFEAWLAAHPEVNADNWGGFGCASINPGKGNTFLIDFAGDAATTGKYTTVELSAADIGLPAARRTFMSVNLFAEHALKDGWYGKVSYTFSKSKGNTEGQTLSDVAQTDVAATQTWDHPEIMEGAYGYLPGDRRHQLKAFAFYQLTPEFDIGANLLIASGRPKNCLGNYAGPSPDFAGGNYDYGASYHYCTTALTSAVDGEGAPYYIPTQTASARGTAGNLPVDKRLDMNFTYKPGFLKGLGLRVDVFNVLNAQTAQAINEIHETGYDPTDLDPTYGRVLSYTAPRSVKLTAMYDIKF